VLGPRWLAALLIAGAAVLSSACPPATPPTVAPPPAPFPDLAAAERPFLVDPLDGYPIPVDAGRGQRGGEGHR
jgi:hypothetical protein